MKSGVKELEGLFKNLNLNPQKSGNMTQIFTEMKKELGEIEALTDGNKIKGAAFGTLEKKVEKVSQLYNKLGKEISSLGGKTGKDLQKLFPPEIGNAINSANSKLKEYEKILNQINNEDGGLNKQKKDLKEAERDYEKLTEKIERLQETLKRSQSGEIKLVSKTEIENTRKEIEDLTNKIEEYKQKVADAEAIPMNKTNNKAGGRTQAWKDAQEDIEKYNELIEQCKQKIQELQTSYNSMQVGSEPQINKELQKTQEEADKAKQAMAGLKTSIQNLESENPGKAFEQIKKELQSIEGLKLDWTKITNIEEFQQALAGKTSAEIEKIQQKIQEVSSKSQNLDQPFRDMTEEVQRARGALDETASSMKEIEQLAQRGLYFFGLTNQVNLFKRAVQSAFETVKELDKSMTETAVVTDFSVGDMWEQLPQYTQIANQYNATLKDAYDVMTLYYQQGLETNQVFAVGEQTMKMARIAGLEYAEATDRMTNALRGFNMEINTTNSERVADVYSQLAAMSASDVDELSNAMTKTASLANSANMQFESTAAFLAQIIETTRESAETAGTALKTVIARFSEVKDLYSKGELLGNIEGEEIDVNKVGKALRAAGVDLNEFLVGAKGLDEIFIELADRWDSLDLLTQRYIATMAAGSRQQSRFIALMSNNERLTELLNGAYNAAGASSNQFAKTQESLESKLNNLKNAWDQFLMGIANSGAIKGVVDLLTKLITTVNKLLEAIGKMGSVPKALASIGLIAGTMKLGSAAVRLLATKFIDFTGILRKTDGKVQSSIGLFKKFALTLSNIKASNFNLGPITDKINAFTASIQKKPYILTFEPKIVGTETIVAEEAAIASENATMVTNNTLRLTSNQLKEQEAVQSALVTAQEEANIAVYNAGNAAVESKLALTAASIDAVEAELLVQNEKIVSNQSLIDSINQETLTETQLMTLKDEKALLDAQELANIEAYCALIEIKSQLMKGEITAEDAAAKIKAIHSAVNVTETGTNLTLAGSFKALGAAIWAVIGPMVTLLATAAPAIAVCAAIAAAIYGIVKAVEAAKEASASGQAALGIENTTTAIKGLQDSLDSTDQILQKLTQDWEAFTGAKDGLNNLIKGTAEWKEQLYDANQKILQLIQDFPDLAQYIKIGENGELYLSDEGIKKKDELEESYKTEKKNKQTAINMQLAQQAYYKSEQEALKEYKDSFKDNKDRRYSVIETHEAHLKAEYASNNPEQLYAADEEDLYAYLNEKISAGKANADDQAYYKYLGKHLQAKQTYKTTNQANVISELVDEGYSNLVAQATSNTLDEITDDLQEEWKNAAKGKGLAGGRSKLEEYAKTINKNYEVVKNSKDKGINYNIVDTSKKDEKGDYEVVYKVDMEGKAAGEGNFTNEQIQLIAKAVQDAEESSQNRKKTANTISKLDKKYQYLLAGQYNKIENLDELQYDKSLEGILNQEEFTEKIASAKETLAKETAIFAGEVKQIFSDSLDEETLKSFTKFTEEQKDGYLTLGKLGVEFNNVNKQSIETLEEFSKINLDDPIEGYAQLVDIAENGSKEASNLAEKIISNNKGVLSSTKQLQTYAQQMTKETQEAILDLIKTNGKITPENLKELAEEDEKLQTLLDNNIVSANGLAKALQLVAQQKIGIEDLTNNFVNALNASRTLKDSILDIQNFISNFNATDYQVGYNWLKESSDKLGELIEKGQYGEAQDYMTAIFGEKENGPYSPEEIQAYYNQLSRYVKSGGYEFFQSVAGTYDNGIKIIAKNGKVTIDTAGKSYDEIIETIKTKTNLSKEAIEMFLLSFSSYSPEFKEIIEDGVITKAVENMFSGVEKNLIISNDELENIKKVYGTSIDKIKAKLKEVANEKGKTFSIFEENEDGTISYTNAEGTQQYEPETLIKKHNHKTTRYIDYESEFAKLQEITNWTNDQINEYLKTYAQEHSLKIKATTENGNVGFFEATDEKLDELLKSEDNVLKIDDSEIDEIENKINHIFNETTYTLKAVIKWAWGGKNDEPKDELPIPEDTGANGKNGTPLQHGKIKTYSRGGATRNENALVGEEGEELIQLKNGGAYLAGTNGPEMVELHKGDIVYPNDETTKIFKRGGISFNRYAEGTNEVRANGILYRKKFNGTWVRVEEPMGLEKPIDTFAGTQPGLDVTTGKLTTTQLPVSGKLNKEQTEELIELLDKELEKKQSPRKNDKEKEKNEKELKGNARYDTETFANAFSDARASNGSGNQYGQKVNNSIGWHRGVDLHNGGGPIPSISSGKVISVVSGYKAGDKKANQGWGNQVIIQDEDGNKFYYSHLKNVNVSNGQVIDPGQIIGTEGSTGNSTGSHLDFMIETSNGFIDPRAFINGADINNIKGGHGGSASYGNGRGSDSPTTATADYNPIIEYLKEQDKDSTKNTEENTKAVEANTKATQELANIEREQSRLDKQLSELKEGGVWTAPWQLANLQKQKNLLKEEQRVQEDILEQKKKEAKELKDANSATIDKYTYRNADGSYGYTTEAQEAIDSGALSGDELQGLQDFISKTNEVADQQDTLDDAKYKWDELSDEQEDIIGEQIDTGVSAINTVIDGMGKVASAVIQMIEAVAQAMVDGFRSFLGWLTIRIDDEHDIGELDESLKNRKELLDWEYEKIAEKNFDYSTGLNSKSQENLFENIDDAAQNVLIRLQNQRRLYENSFRQLEDLGTNINSDIECALEDLYDALYGIDGVFTKVNDRVQYLEQRFEQTMKWNLTKIREWDPIETLNEHLQTKIQDDITKALDPLKLFDNTLIDKFFKKSFEQIAQLEITEYRVGDMGESLLQKVANFFYELSPKFDADYQIVNKSELVDALKQKMETIITNGTITSQFVNNYLDYLTEIESQMENEVSNIRGAESEILSLYDEMTEILEKGKDEYNELAQDLYDAIVSEKESIKEELEELNSNITDGDSDLINILKANLDRIRQQRENDKTEQDLMDKEARLAYLKQDTSGANKQEILKLEKELKEGQQSYTDKLIDQKISELEKQNEEAATQRQVQIDLLQEEINNSKKIWEQVYALMDGLLNWDHLLLGEIDRDAYYAVMEQLKKGKDYQDSSDYSKEDTENTWQALIRKASLYGTMKTDRYKDIYANLQTIKDVLDNDTKLMSDHAQDGMWNNYVAFTNLETAVKDNTSAVKKAVNVINSIVNAKTLSFDETGSIFTKATNSGGQIQALSGLEYAATKLAEDVSSGLPGILTQVTTGIGNLMKGSLRFAGALADSAAGMMTGDIALGDVGDGIGKVVEGMSNLFAAGCDAASLFCQIVGDTAPGFTDMGVAAGTMIANWIDNAFEEVNDHLIENVDRIKDEMYGEIIDGRRYGGQWENTGRTIRDQKEALRRYMADNNSGNRSTKEIVDFVDELYAGIEQQYAEIDNLIKTLDENDIEGINKQYARFHALQKVLERIGHTENVETYLGRTINSIEKWAGETGSIFAEMSEKEVKLVVAAINEALLPIIQEETIANGDPKTDIWESNLKFRERDIKYYNDIYKELLDNSYYSVDAIDEVISVLNSIYLDTEEGEYTSPSAQLLIEKLEQLLPKRADQMAQTERTIWETFLGKMEDGWGEFGNKILQLQDKFKSGLNSLIEKLTSWFGEGSAWANFFSIITTPFRNFLHANGYASGGSIGHTQNALTGELGPELVQHTDGTATIVGRNGPEISKLRKGDQVYTAQQTRKILKGAKGMTFNRFAEGTVDTFMARDPFNYGLIGNLNVNYNALGDASQSSRENSFNFNLSLEGLTVDSVERVEEVADRVWDKLNTTVRSAMWPYNTL